MQQMVDELAALLEAARLGGPYVMVGHSLGGLLVRLYASQHRSSIGGMVLVDPTTEEQDARMWALLPPDVMEQFKGSLSQSPEGLNYESLVAGMAQLRSADRSLGESPLVVLTALGEQEAAEPGVPAEVGARIAREWLAMHEEVSRLSSNSAHILLHDSGHDVAHDAPHVVVVAIDEVLTSVRTKRPLAAEKVHRLAKPRGP
jgi:pimeloyl-ACP methyl ester carboxylesterase